MIPEREIEAMESLEQLLGEPDIARLIDLTVTSRPTRIGKATAAAIAADIVSTLQEIAVGRRRAASAQIAARLDRDRDRRQARRDAALERFRRWSGWMGVDFYRTPAAVRVQEALDDVTGWRRADNQREQPNELAMLAVRVTADVLASQIGAAAGPGQDPDTVAWVLAGLRCRSRPFCTGCPSCQTVTSPARPNAEPARTGGWR